MVWCAVVCVACGVALSLPRRWRLAQVSSWASVCIAAGGGGACHNGAAHSIVSSFSWSGWQCITCFVLVFAFLLDSFPGLLLRVEVLPAMM
jgi:hypothetical protein